MTTHLSPMLSLLCVLLMTSSLAIGDSRGSRDRDRDDDDDDDESEEYSRWMITCAKLICP